MMSDENFDKKQKMLTVLQWFTNKIPNDISGAYNALTGFASCTGIKKTSEKSADSPNTPIKKRIAYRQVRISDIKDKNERKRILKIKRAVAFPHKPISAEKTGEIFSF